MTGGPGGRPGDARRAHVVVLDLAQGGLDPLVRMLERQGAQVRVSDDRGAAAEADGLVVAAAGEFPACIAGLRAVHGPQVIGRRLAGGRAVLGIGAGMQVLFERWVPRGAEVSGGKVSGGEVPGVGEWPGTVEPLAAPDGPHTGWVSVQAPTASTLFAGVEDRRFYFHHSCAVRRWELSTTTRRFRLPLVAWSEHRGDQLVAAVENGPLTATQFHPEESGEAGATLIGNWLRTLG